MVTLSRDELKNKIQKINNAYKNGNGGFFNVIILHNTIRSVVAKVKVRIQNDTLMISIDKFNKCSPHFNDETHTEFDIDGHFSVNFDDIVSMVYDEIERNPFFNDIQIRAKNGDEVYIRPYFKGRKEMAGEESTVNPIFLFQKRIVHICGLPSSMYYCPECEDVFDNDMESHMLTHQEDSTTADEIVSEQELIDNGFAIETWETELVFGSREESDSYGDMKHYNYLQGWRTYCIPAYGSLVSLLNEHDNRIGIMF